jgi:predicted O-methyltransferase YrrM
MNFNRFGGHQGQMMLKEREALYNHVLDNRPMVCFEVGTWKGGGSTYTIASAANEYGGVLHSVEIDPDFHNEAVNLYNAELSDLSNVKLYQGDAVSLIRNIGEINFLFLDGSEDGQQTLDQLVSADIPMGGTLAVHDWHTPKTNLIRPQLLYGNKWEQLCLITDTDTGFGIFRRTA